MQTKETILHADRQAVSNIGRETVKQAVSQALS
jgi:hypothetical protein